MHLGKPGVKDWFSGKGVDRCRRQQWPGNGKGGAQARQHHLELSSEQKVLGQQATAEQKGINTGTHLIG